jgi:hypothetical protein
MTTPDKTETRIINHVFTPPEREQLHGDLLNALATKDTTEGDFENVKATWKAKITEAEARIDTIAATLRAGFEMRPARCVVVYRYQDGKKDYYLEGGSRDVPVLTEQMTDDDFQAELLAAESQFENREEIELFQPTANDSGILVVGRYNDRWFSAVRVKVGSKAITERLDSEQRAYKQRFDAIKTAAKTASQWLKDNLKDLAKGFEEPIAAAVEAHKERAE